MPVSHAYLALLEISTCARARCRSKTVPYTYNPAINTEKRGTAALCGASKSERSTPKPNKKANMMCKPTRNASSTRTSEEKFEVLTHQEIGRASCRERVKAM